MPRNGAGQYTLPAGNPVVTGQIISSTTQNNTMNDVASALSSSISNDGQTPVIADLPMSGFKHTGAADGVSAGDYATIRQLTASGADLIGVAHLVSTMAQLRLLTKTGSGTALVDGYNAAADGGGGIYTYVSSDTTSGALITASASGTTLTVTSVTNGTLSVGQLVSRSDTGAAIAYITALGTGSGGTGTYTLSTSVTVSSMTMMADNGGSLIVAADGGRWKLNFLGSINIAQFGADTTGANDSAFSIAAAWNASKWLVIPSGTYKASVLPNFASNGARIETIGSVVINYTGVGNGLVFDSGSGAGVKNYNIQVGPITINGTASASNGVYIRGITHSSFKRLRPINFPLSAMRCEFMVSNTFEDFCYSGNEAGITITTANGIILEKRNAGEQSSDCTFINPIIEGTSGDGIYGSEAAQCTFIGGTSEGNGYGGGAGAVYLGANSFGNTITGLDMEQNGKSGDSTSYHVKDLGLRNKFITPFCDATISAKFWAAGGNSGSIDGGKIADLVIDAAVKNFQTRGMAYTGTVTDNGVSSRHIQRFFTPGAVVDVVDSNTQVKTWTPTVTGLTVVGTPTYSGTYIQIGKMIMFWINVTSTTSTANPVAGTGRFTLPIAGSIPGMCAAASNSTSTGLGQGSGAVDTTLCYPPTWPADNNITISGWYLTP